MLFAPTGLVIDGDSRLVVIYINIELDSSTFIFDTVGFHLNTPRHKFPLLKNGGDPIEYMVIGFFDIVGYHVFKGAASLLR